MQLDDYRAYSTALTQNLANDPRVLGLIALGLDGRAGLSA